jgi:hypothetical protein
MSRPSSRQSSQEILYQGLASGAKIIRRTHSAIQKELAAMEAELTRPLTLPARKMELLRCIVEIGAELSRQSESIAKLITSKPTPRGGDTSTIIPTAQDIMLEITEGRKAGRSGG